MKINNELYKSETYYETKILNVTISTQRKHKPIKILYLQLKYMKRKYKKILPQNNIVYLYQSILFVLCKKIHCILYAWKIPWKLQYVRFYTNILKKCTCIQFWKNTRCFLNESLREFNKKIYICGSRFYFRCVIFILYL